MSTLAQATTFPAGSGRLSYTIEGAGPLVVCVPGGPGFDPVAYLADLRLPGFRLLKLALRGTGASTPPSTPDGYRIAGYVEDLEALRRHLGAERLTLYGASHGGSVAIAYASAHPQRVERLVLSGPPTQMDEAFAAAVARARQRFAYAVWDGAERLAAADAAAAALAGELTEDERRRQLRVMLSRYVAHQGPAQAAYLDGICAAPLNSDAVPVMFAEMREGLDLLARAGRITAPALVLAGSLDVVVPPAVSQLAAHALPGGQYVELAEAGHFADVDAPSEFAGALRGFLTTPVAEGAR